MTSDRTPPFNISNAGDFSFCKTMYLSRFMLRIARRTESSRTPPKGAFPTSLTTLMMQKDDALPLEIFILYIEMEKLRIEVEELVLEILERNIAISCQAQFPGVVHL